MAKENTRKEGRKSELLAEKYLSKKGFILLEKNFQTHNGEIDLIMEHDGFIVFVEVKSLKNDREGHIYETFTRTKRKRVYKAIRDWLRVNKKWNAVWRVDFLGIVEREGKFVLSHFKFVEVGS